MTYFLCSDNKSDDQMQLICAFIFAYAESKFSNDTAPLYICSAIMSRIVGHKSANKQVDYK